MAKESPPSEDPCSILPMKCGVRFVAAKSKVAPLKELTIPRLEVHAALVVSCLGKTILQEARLKFERVHYLSDRRIALACIQGESGSYEPFVS